MILPRIAVVVAYACILSGTARAGIYWEVRYTLKNSKEQVGPSFIVVPGEGSPTAYEQAKAWAQQKARDRDVINVRLVKVSDGLGQSNASQSVGSPIGSGGGAGATDSPTPALARLLQEEKRERSARLADGILLGGMRQQLLDRRAELDEAINRIIQLRIEGKDTEELERLYKIKVAEYEEQRKKLFGSVQELSKRIESLYGIQEQAEAEIRKQNRILEEHSRAESLAKKKAEIERRRLEDLQAERGEQQRRQEELVTGRRSSALAGSKWRQPNYPNGDIPLRINADGTFQYGYGGNLSGYWEARGRSLRATITNATSNYPSRPGDIIDISGGGESIRMQFYVNGAPSHSVSLNRDAD